MPPRQRRTNITHEQLTQQEAFTKNRKRIITTVLVTIIAVISIGAALVVGAKTFLDAAQSSSTVELDTHVNDQFVQDSPNQQQTPQTSGPADGATDYLLVGADSRVDMQGKPLSEEQQKILRSGDVDTTNTDVIMVMRVTNDGNKASVISIPRDTYVTDREFGNTKINGVYGMHQAKYKSANGQPTPEVEKAAADEGRKALAEVVGTLTGITIDHYVEVGLYGFATFTDAVGGVDVCLNQATNDPMTGASFPAGQQTLNGPDALAFVRQRYGLDNGDLDRVKRQQAYLSSMANKLLSAGTLTNPNKLRNLVNATKEAVAIDQNLDLMDAASVLTSIDPSNITFDTIPVVTINGVGDHGESVVEVDKQVVQDFFASSIISTNAPQPQVPQENINADALTPQDTSNLPSDIAAVTAITPARVFSTTGDVAIAKESAKKLSDDGIVVTDIALSPAQWSGHGAQVLVSAKSPSAERVGAILGLPVVVEPTIPSGMIIVLVGGAVSNVAPSNSGDVAPSFNDESSAPAPIQTGETTVADGIVCVN